jgi:nitronate monooxygenase
MGEMCKARDTQYYISQTNNDDTMTTMAKRLHLSHQQIIRMFSSETSNMTRRLLNDTGATIPVFCGPMYPGSNPELVAAVSGSGGFGIAHPLAISHLYGHKDFRTGVKLIKQLSGNKPFGVNCTILPNEKYKKMMDDCIDVSIEEGVKFFLTSLGKPDEIVKKAHSMGIKVYHDVHNVELARRAAGAGVDGLNLLNKDMGGQTGMLDAESFINEVKTLNLGIPLVCAGGVGDENGFAAALDMGYAGVQMGTRFLATHECLVTSSYKQAIVNATSDDIVRTNKLAGVDSSVIRTKQIEQGGLRVNWLVSWLLKQPSTKNIARMFLLQRAVDSYKKSAFDEDFEIWQAGKGVSAIDKVESVAAIMERFSVVTQQKLK